MTFKVLILEHPSATTTNSREINERNRRTLISLHLILTTVVITWASFLLFMFIEERVMRWHGVVWVDLTTRKGFPTPSSPSGLFSVCPLPVNFRNDQPIKQVIQQYGLAFGVVSFVDADGVRPCAWRWRNPRLESQTTNFQFIAKNRR